MKVRNFTFQTLSLLLSGILLSSCSGMLYTSIDILRPAKVAFPTDVTHVLLVNNTQPQPSGYGHTTDLFNESEKQIEVNTDSLAIFHLASLSENINEKEFFGRIDLEYNSINRYGDFFDPKKPVEVQIKSLSEQYGAGGIISLNRILVKDCIAEMYNQSNNAFIAYLEAIYETRWSIHFPDKNEVIPLTIQDTVYWESESASRQRSLAGLPSRKDALIDGALITGEKAVKNFIPYWETADRYFFDSKKADFKAGIDSVYRKDWAGAIRKWETLSTSTKNQFTKGKLFHNIAIANELNGNIQKAAEYSDKALSCFQNALFLDYNSWMAVFNYNKEIRKRVTESKNLNEQLGE